MKKILTCILTVLLCLTVVSPAFAAADAAGSLPWLHTEGETIVDDTGSRIVLRGTNFGGWGIMEDWFCPFTEPSGEEGVYATLVSRFGQDKTHELFKLYRSNWITETDYANVAEMGMNVIRLPLWYRNFLKNEDGDWYLDENGQKDFSELDGVVEMCRKYGLYLIIDMHGLPGYQNDYDHCGKSKSMALFNEGANGDRYRRAALELWVEIAKRYADEPTVAMYDLMNEPLGTNITVDSSKRQRFWDFSDELYRAIREVDSRHIICMEAIWDPWAIASPGVYGWTNVVYQEHLYDVTNPSVLRKANEIKSADYGIPFYIGEFYPRGISSFDYILSLFNSRELCWTTWTYKGTGGGADDSPWFLYGSSSVAKIDHVNDSWETLCDKWGERLRTDSGEFSRTTFADYLGNYTDGSVDNVSLYSFGSGSTLGTFEQRRSMALDKPKAIITTIKDWIRKLFAGQLL